jgi:hypothetical protein
MIRRPIELTPAVARTFVKDMKAFFAAKMKGSRLALAAMR